MKRRTFVTMAGGTTAVASPLLGGCLGSADDSDYRWRYDAGGELDALVDGSVLARERHNGSPEAEEAVVSLDAETGERQWSYEPATGGQDRYSGLAVSDGVYFSQCSDDDCRHLHALDLDGEERWTRDVDSGHRRPVVTDGVVYVGDDTGLVRAVDQTTGETRWDQQVETTEPAKIVDVVDGVYVESNAALVCLDPDDGSTRWRYVPGDDSEQVVSGATISNGVAYVVTFDQVVAVADGEELWSRDIEQTGIDLEAEIAGVASNHLFVVARNDPHEFRLHAFDVPTGERDWASEPIAYPTEEYSPQAAIRDEIVYVGSERVRALDAATGNERWSAALDGDSIWSVSAVDENGAGDHAVFVLVGESLLVSFAPDGDRLWEGSVDEPVRDYLVDESVFVATGEGMYALDRRNSQ